VPTQHTCLFSKHPRFKNTKHTYRDDFSRVQERISVIGKSRRRAQKIEMGGEQERREEFVNSDWQRF
jgi:hypothetical protein